MCIPLPTCKRNSAISRYSAWTLSNPACGLEVFESHCIDQLSHPQGNPYAGRFHKDHQVVVGTRWAGRISRAVGNNFAFFSRNLL